MDRKEISTGLKDFAEYINYISIGLLVLQLIVFIAAMATKTSLVILTAILGVSALVSFTVLKEYSSNDHIKKQAFAIFKVSFVVFLLGAINDMLWMFLGLIDNNLISFLPLVADAIVIIFIVAMFQDPEKKMQETLDEFYRSDFKSFRANQNKEVTEKPGCAILGTDTTTHKPVILPLKDRYLHTLILGPTGSGKTSQSIIPMIYRDIQHKGDDKLGIIVLEPKGDLAEKVYAMCELFDRKGYYFNPMLKNCPYFNPLMGSETDVIENFVTTFNAFTSDSSSFFRNGNEVLLRRAIAVCYRVVEDDYKNGRSTKQYPTLIDLDTVLNNAGGNGKKMMRKFFQISFQNNERAVKEQHDIYHWFMDDYYSVTQGRPSKSYENTSDVRTILTKIISNKFLRDVLCPPDIMTPEEEARGFIDFRRCLAEREVIAISSAEGDLRDLGTFLGYFLILSLQSAVFSRPGNENTRPGCMLYIDEFQTYANTQFGNMLTKGRSYRVACHLATQNRALIGMNSGKNAKSFTELVDTNCRNLILYPGGNPDDAKYYSAKFGEEEYIDRQVSVSRQKFNPVYGWMMRAPSTTEREVEAKRARITPSEIMYREFGMITYSIIQNNTLQPPGVSQIQYIPREVNDKLDEMVAERNARELLSASNEFSRSALWDADKKNTVTKIEDDDEITIGNENDYDDDEYLDVEDGIAEYQTDDISLEDDMFEIEDTEDVENGEYPDFDIEELRDEYNKKNFETTEKTSDDEDVEDEEL